MKNTLLFKLMLTVIGLLYLGNVRAQSIYTALNLNEKQDYKTVRPKQIIETSIFYNSNGKEVKKDFKTFDNAGMLITEERRDDNDELTSRLIYTNDTVNRIVLSRAYEQWNKILGHTQETAVYVYDNKHFLVRVLDKNAAGNIYDKFEIENNEHGDPIALSGFNFNGQLFGREKAAYFYDKNKAAVSVIRNDGEILSTDTITVRYKKNILFKEPDMAFNDNGDMTAWSSQNYKHTQTTFYESDFTYDSKGNCTNQTIYKVTIKKNGKRKREMNREFKKVYIY